MAGEDWPLVPLGELTENLDGRRVPVKEIDRRPGSYPYYGASGIVDHVDDYLFDGEYLLIGEDGENLRTRQTPIAFMATGKFWVNNNAHIVRANQRSDTRFLGYVLSQTDISGYLTGSTMPKLTQGNLNRLPVIAPPLAEQKAIAAVLGNLDDKIELNRRMNATLKAMARALFQSWFVDFDPVRAKLDGRQPIGLDPATATLFTAAVQDSLVGHIPHGWKVGVLDDLTSSVIGGDWGESEATDDETVSCYCIRGADIPSLQSGGFGKMPTRFLKPSSVEKRQLADGDLAIEISGGSPTQCTGRPVLVSEALLQSLGQPLVASNFCRIVKLKSPALSKFVYLWLRRLYDAVSCSNLRLAQRASRTSPLSFSLRGIHSSCLTCA